MTEFTGTHLNAENFGKTLSPNKKLRYMYHDFDKYVRPMTLINMLGPCHKNIRRTLIQCFLVVMGLRIWYVLNFFRFSPTKATLENVRYIDSNFFVFSRY